jgi:cell division protein FtsW (lipid II flippase)
MDKIHRPKFAWSVVIFAMIIGLSSILVHAFLLNDYAAGDADGSLAGSYTFCSDVLMGFGIMLLVYLMDYTVIAKYSRAIAVVMMVIKILSRFGPTVNGAVKYLTLGPVSFLITAFILLYVPVYGGILYKYRGGGAGSFIKALCWLIIPVMIFATPSIMILLVLVISLSLQLSVAIAKGWYKIPRVPVLASLWSVIVLGPVVLVASLFMTGRLSDYQIARFRAFIYADNEQGYVTRIVRSLAGVNLLGDTGKEIFGSLPDVNCEFLLLYLANRYGFAIAISTVVAVLAVVIMGILACTRCKNQLGLVMGIGCMNVLLANLIINVLENLGLLPYSSSFMPFFSAGGSNVILAFIMLGIILSIYKYKEAYTEHVDVRTNFKFKIEKVR